MRKPKAKENPMSKNQNEQQTDLSRRSFLKKSSMVAASLPVAGVLLQSDEAQAAQAAKPAVTPEPAPAVQAAPARSGMKYLFVDRKSCTGCKACEIACSQYHEDGVFRPSKARIHVRRYKSIVDVPVICWHCEDAPCVAACPITPTRAIAKNKETNVITFTDEATCLGASCNKCMEACPAQYLRRNPDTGKPMFCDLCGGNPQCVQACERMADKELTPCLDTKKSGGGVNLAYREVTPDEAAEGLILDMFYPNKDGGRV